MIDRYSLEQMRNIWSEENKLSLWLKIEILVCEAMSYYHLIPKDDFHVIQSKAKFNRLNIQAIEQKTNHDVIAFIEEVAEQIGLEGRWLHRGMTSSDLLDTALACQINESISILLKDIHELQAVICRLIQQHENTLMIGRSHGMHAEPITFGFKLGVMYDEFSRAKNRLNQTHERLAVGMISGAVGTNAHLDPKIENYVCEKLQLKVSPISTQIIQRDRHAEFLSVIALIGSSIDCWATELRHLQRTEVLEVQESFSSGQKGSSAMPHKKNPITSERLCGLARILRGNAQVAMENVALWHERDISHSSAERIIIPDSCMLLDYMLVVFSQLLDNLTIFPENMQKNMDLSLGLFASQSLLLALIDKGVPRKLAYETVQSIAMKTLEKKISFIDSSLSEPSILQYFSQEELNEICSLDKHFYHIKSKLLKIGVGVS